MTTYQLLLIEGIIIVSFQMGRVYTRLKDMKAEGRQSLDLR